MPRKLWYAVIGVAVLAAVGAGWYLLAPPREAPPAMAGMITGTTLYPSDFNPAQTVCAQSVSDTTWTSCVNVPEQSASESPMFSIRVPAGTYWVYSVITNPSEMGLDQSPKAYYTRFVLCGLRFDCTDHTKINVEVGSAQTVTDVRPHDWYEQ